MGQNSTDENRSIFSKNLNSFYKNPSQTLRVANYLLDNATTDLEKAKALYLISESEKLQGNYIESIESLFNAKTLVTTSEDPFISTLILVSIAERCRLSGVNDIANNYLQQAESQLQDIQSKANKAVANIIVLQERMDTALQNRDNSDVVTFNDSNVSFVNEIETTYPSLVASHYIKLGNVAIMSNEFSSALTHFERALEVLKQADLDRSSMEAEALQGIALAEIHRGELKIAEELLLQGSAIPVVEKPVMAKILDGLVEIYSKTDSIQGFQQRSKERATVNASIVASERKMRNSILSEIEKSQQSEIVQDKIRYDLIGGILLALMLLFFVVYFWYNRKLDKQYQKFEKIIQQLENKVMLEAPKETSSEQQQEGKGVIIPEETQQVILQRLDSFEASTKYTNADMSLSVLAKQLQTNTKYVSEIIHVHKNKNFNTYINELRINHIIQLMKEDKKYLNYKVSYLAEESGFSSHSAFTVVFKSITGITPKQFITFLKKEEKVAS